MRKALAEFIGTGLLLTAVIGSGTAAQSLSPTDTGLELLENAAATGSALVAIILALGSVSGAHLNPVVSTADGFFGGLRPRELTAYVIAQVAGAVVGVIVANLMFSLPAVSVSSHLRSTPGMWLGEVIATFGVHLVVFGVVRSGRTAAGPFAVGAYITGAYVFNLVHQLCQSRRHTCAHTVRQVRGYRSVFRGALRASPGGRRDARVRDGAVPVAENRGFGRGRTGVT